MSCESQKFREALVAGIAPCGLVLDNQQLDQLGAHYEKMVQANQTMNLTRITDPVEAAVKHYADSLAMVLWLRDASELSILDIGTGAGFPAVPVAVARPQWHVTGIDGTKKKAEFVRRTAGELGLTNLTVEHAHSDHWDSRRKFDIVATRAVASLEKCLRSGRRFLKQGGKLIAYKTASLDAEELQEANAACRELQMEMEEPFRYELGLRGEKLVRSLYVARR